MPKAFRLRTIAIFIADDKNALCLRVAKRAQASRVPPSPGQVARLHAWRRAEYSKLI
jgi:hypothetical protein